MTDLNHKEYIVIVQCHIVKERCSGYNCERAFHERTGGFAEYPKDKTYRMLNMTCGGCCGRAIHRKLSNLIRRINKTEGITKDQIIVQLSSCITKDNFHAPPCPHLDYLKSLIVKLGLDVCEDTYIYEKSETRRKAGLYNTNTEEKKS
jgi:predicted metal-binding protein